MRSSARKSVVVIGGGFTGVLFAMAAAARHLDVVLVERARDAGPGLAYGARSPSHLLNVPVARMEIGQTPTFAQWLVASGADLSEALAEAGGELARAFVPRHLFGAYLSERFEAALHVCRGRLTRLRGEVVQVSGPPSPAVQLADGRIIAATHVVLATGNLPPSPPRCRDGGLYDSPLFVPDPWRTSELDDLPPAAPVLLIGSGLTMVDVALMLTERGHVGPIWSVSRHGLLPQPHAEAAARGAGPVRLPSPLTAGTPVRAMRMVRAAAAQAMREGIAWQNVMDAVRPHVAAIWAGWSQAERARFLRHARAHWDVHRHRTSRRVASALQGLLASGRLKVRAGRITALDPMAGGVRASVRLRGTRRVEDMNVARVVNCTGPRSDIAGLRLPPFDGLVAAGHLVPDPLGLGPRTRGAATVDRHGRPSGWLYALGPLARAALWEITAVPEIALQAQRLAEELARPPEPHRHAEAGLIADFVDLGTGI